MLFINNKTKNEVSLRTALDGLYYISISFCIWRISSKERKRPVIIPTTIRRDQPCKSSAYFGPRLIVLEYHLSRWALSWRFQLCVRHFIWMLSPNYINNVRLKIHNIRKYQHLCLYSHIIHKISTISLLEFTVK